MWTVLTPSGRGQLWQKLVCEDAVSETEICEGGEKDRVRRTSGVKLWV